MVTVARADGADREPPARAGQRVAAFGLVCNVLLFAGGLAMMFQTAWPNPADVSAGDNGDGLVLIATLEHWWRALNGVAVGGSWRQAGFFYPMVNPTGLTDSYLGFAIPFCLLRFCAVGPFTAFTLTMGLFAAIGYWSFYAFCRVSALACRAAAMLAAWMFAFGAIPLFLAGHAQTYTIMLSPLIELCLLRAWRAAWPSRARWGLLAGLVYGLILLSAPQTAWFLSFVGGVTLPIFLVLRRPALRQAPWVLPQAAGFGLGALLGLAATAFVNRPDQAPIQVRPLAEIYFYSPHLTDILHQPLTELFWNDVAGRLGLFADQARPMIEIALGYGPVLLLTLLIGCGLTILRWRSWRADPASAVIVACVLAPLLCWLAQVRLLRDSIWAHLVFRVPGGALIRTPFRIQDACVMVALLALACLFTRLLAGGSRARVVLASVLALLLVGEQLSHGLGMRQTAEVTGWFARVGAPPATCRSFYVTPGDGPHQQWYVYQSEAMMLAQWVGLPTLNGNSSWYPDGWEMKDTVGPGYLAAVRAWVARNGLRDVCRLDASSAQWTLEAAAPGG